ncbi:hypothetical protein [Paenibacillus azoreducens]|uniref:hypothetical protein n=1 Tax=Paenibacillus azoreducens TaxID=116718 RepID=UPI001BB3E090|nr:hypothetical protein [Paenibacillus azoreducens]
MPPILYLPCFDYQVHLQHPQQLPLDCRSSLRSSLRSERRKEHVRIGRSPAQFLRQLDEALLHDRAPDLITARRNSAFTESWINRAEFIKDRMIEKFLQKHGSSG